MKPRIDLKLFVWAASFVRHLNFEEVEPGTRCQLSGFTEFGNNSTILLFELSEPYRTQARANLLSSAAERAIFETAA